ncbi:MAG TPA: VWA domain-containing protein [Vicinamibacterales bacterium]
MTARRRAAPVLAALIVCAAAVTAAQRGEPPTFRSAIELTTVNATVVDRSGHLVRELPREAFEVFEDGEPQVVSQFTNERVPVSLAMLLDVSDSMFGKRIADAREAVQTFVTDLLDPADEFSILAFNHRQHLLTEWTDDREAAEQVLAPIHPSGSTAIYDAILATLPLVESRRRQRAALLLISDGGDTASDATLRDVRSALLRSDAFVYAIAIEATTRYPINRPVAANALKEITDQSGGSTQVVQSSGEVISAMWEIADELNSQYLIGYTSAKSNDGKYHSIRVRVKGSDYRVRARNGYVGTRR